MNIIFSFMDYCGAMRREAKSNPDETIADFRYETITDIVRKCVDLVGFENIMRIALDHHEMNIMNDMQDIFKEAQSKMNRKENHGT